MPAFSFMGQFVPMVEDGTKPHTIRGRRKAFAKPGDTLYLYFAQRSKWCRKLREEICTNVRTIIITADDIYLFEYRLSDAQAVALEGGLINGQELLFIGKRLDDTLRSTLAWADGFRPNGSTIENPMEAFDLMIRFWRHTHQLPFIGDLIDWNPTSEGRDKALVKRLKLATK